MQNINLVYTLGPIIALVSCLALLIFSRLKGQISRNVLFYSLIAYALAIGVKYVIQFFTFTQYDSLTGGNTFALGVYYGLRTSLLEAGFALLIASFALKRSRLNAKNAEGYGIGLAFWENGVLLGVIPLISYLTYYIILSSDSSQAQVLYEILASRQPELFYTLNEALPLLAYSILERISSIILHFVWGFLSVYAIAYKKRSLIPLILLLAFPADFLVPFSSLIGLPLVELLVFITSLVALIIMLLVTRMAEITFNPTVTNK